MTENRAVTSFLCICFSGCCSMEVAAAGACGCGRPGKAACEWVVIDTDLGDDDLPDVTDLFNSLVKDEHKLGGGNAAAAAKTMNAYVHRAAEASLFGELKPDRVRLSNSKKHGHYHTSRVPAAGVAASELPGTYQATTGGADAGGAAEGGEATKDAKRHVWRNLVFRRAHMAPRAAGGADNGSQRQFLGDGFDAVGFGQWMEPVAGGTQKEHFLTRCVIWPAALHLCTRLHWAVNSEILSGYQPC